MKHFFARYWLLVAVIFATTWPAAAQTPSWQWGLQTVNPTPTDGSPAAGNAVATDAAGRVYVGGTFGETFYGTRNTTRSFGSAGTVGPSRGGFVAQATAAGQWAWVTGIIPTGASGNPQFSASVTGVAVTAAGDIYAAGTVQAASLQIGSQTATLNVANKTLFVARFSNTGACQWIRTVDGQFEAPALAADPSTGGLVLAGCYRGTPTFGSTPLPLAINNALVVARLSAAGQWLGTAVSTGAASLLSDALAIAVGPAGQVGVVCNQTSGSITFGATTLTIPTTNNIAFVAVQLSPTNQWQWAVGGSGSSESLAFGAAYTPAGALWISGRGIGGTLVGPIVLVAPASAGNSNYAGFVGQLSAAGQWNTVQQLSPSGSGLAAFGPLAVDGAGNVLAVGGLRGFAGSVQGQLGSQLLTTPGTGILIFVTKLSAAGQWRYVAAVPPTTLSDGFNPIASALDATNSLYVTGALRGGLTLGTSTLNGSYDASTTFPGWGDAVLGKLINTNVLATHSAMTTAPLASFPNPAHTQATLTLPTGNAAQAITLADALGRPVRTYPVAARTTTATLDLNGLAPGLYVVRCGAATGKLVVE